ncbi:MAG: hypothetical protein LIP23_05330 [Planctomycetes bacterium]|nr:hypothetical protein [Planctomycetota bacterium]
MKTGIGAGAKIDTRMAGRMYHFGEIPAEADVIFTNIEPDGQVAVSHDGHALFSDIAGIDDFAIADNSGIAIRRPRIQDRGIAFVSAEKRNVRKKNVFNIVINCATGVADCRRGVILRYAVFPFYPQVSDGIRGDGINPYFGSGEMAISQMDIQSLNVTHIIPLQQRENAVDAPERRSLGAIAGIVIAGRLDIQMDAWVITLVILGDAVIDVEKGETPLHVDIAVNNTSGSEHVFGRNYHAAGFNLKLFPFQRDFVAGCIVGRRCKADGEQERKPCRQTGQFEDAVFINAIRVDEVAANRISIFAAFY